MRVTWATHPLKMRHSLGTPKRMCIKLVSGPPQGATFLLDSHLGSEQRSSHLSVCKNSTARCLRGDGFLLVHSEEIWEGARKSFILPGNNIPVRHSAPGKKVSVCYRLTPESQQSIHPQGTLFSESSKQFSAMMLV